MRTFLITLLIITSISCKKHQEESLVTLYIPNAFYPESIVDCADGSPSCNREFKVTIQNATRPYLKSFDLWVYTFSGTEVFHSTDVNIGWNGKYRTIGPLVPAGNYTYLVRITDNGDHTIIKKGRLMLVR